MPLGPCLGFKAKRCKFLLFIFLFHFAFLFLFSLFWETHWPSSPGVLNLLKVVNETRLVFLQGLRVRQFFSLLLKPNVHSVWLARGGRKRSKATRIQLIIHSTRHGSNLTSIGLDKISIFQTASR